MKKIIFIVPDGTGIKNYLFSDFLKLLKERKFKIVLLHNLAKEAIYEVEKIHQTKLEQYKLKPYHEKKYHKFLRESIAYARLLNNKKLTKNETILDNWLNNKKGIKRVFYDIVKLYAGFLAKDYRRIEKLEQQYKAKLFKSKNDYDTILKKIKPDVVFNTHQRSLLAILPVIAAQKLNIRNLGAIYSWDNLPKARLTVRTDEYMVWSEYMKQEMHNYYPEIDTKMIHITGTPQFEFYYNKKLIWGKEKFYQLHNIPFDKKIILYSGGDIRTSPYDQLYVEEVAKQLCKIPNKDRPVLLVRPTPVDKGGRYRESIKKYPDTIRLSTPIWKKHKHWSYSFPNFDDVVLLTNTVFFADTVINVGSTMAFDFTTFDKPAIYIDFNIVNDKNWDIHRINSFEHFKSKQGLNPVIMWQKPEDLPHILKDIFDKRIKLQNKEWFYKINKYPKSASKKIVDLIDK